MVFVVESGSTKSDWMLIKDAKPCGEFTTIGFNPFFCTTDFIVSELHKNEGLTDVAQHVQAIYFYGF